MKLALTNWFDRLAVAACIVTVACLGGCAMVNGVPSANLTPAAAADLQAAADSYCPVLGAAQTQVSITPAIGTTDVNAALKLLAEVCPPNPLPTNGAVILVDLLQAYETIEPILPKKTAVAARAKYQAMRVKYHALLK